MNKLESTMAQQVAQAASEFQQKRTGHAPRSVTVNLSDQTLVITLHGALSPAEPAYQAADTFLAHAPGRYSRKRARRSGVARVTARVIVRTGAPRPRSRPRAHERRASCAVVRHVFGTTVTASAAR